MEHYQVNKTAVLLLVLALVGRGAGLATAQEQQQRKGATSQPTKQAKTLSAPDEARATAIKKLIQQLGDDRFAVRENAHAALIAIGRPALPALLEARKSEDIEVRHRAEVILEAIRTSLPVLLENLKDKDVRVRADAAETLERLGAQAKPAVTALTEALKDKEAAVREAAISALLTIDPENKAVAKAVPEKARVQGKYSKLLRRIHVPQDKQSYSEFKEYGHYQATDYAGHTNLPAGHWVYVYPHWYIWGEMKQGK